MSYTGYSYKTKAYTLNSLIEEVADINAKAEIYDIIDTLSPRAGAFSAKFEVIDTWLGGQLNRVLHGETTIHVAGATPRTRLLNALKQRKNKGYFFG